MLIVGGVSGAGMIAWMEDYRPILMVVTFAFLGTAFYLNYRPRSRPSATSEEGGAAATPKSRTSGMMTVNRVMLWAVTALVVVFLFFPQALTGWFSPGEDLTADMERSVVQIEGMT